MRILALAAAIWLGGAGQALSQEWSVEIDGPRIGLLVPAGAEIPTEDELAARLKEAVQWPRVVVGPIATGGEIFSGVSQSPRVGRLRNDIYRRGQFGAEPELLLPRGAAVYSIRYSYGITSPNGNEALLEMRWRLWCGAAPASGDAPRAAYCIRVLNDRADIAEVVAGQSPFLARDFGPFASSTVPDIDETDATVRAEIPVIPFSYELMRVRARRLELTYVGRHDGDEARYPVEVERDSEGAAVIDHGSIIVRLRPGAERNTFVAELVQPQETELRAFAADMIARARAEQAARQRN